MEESADELLDLIKITSNMDGLFVFMFSRDKERNARIFMALTS